LAQPDLTMAKKTAESAPLITYTQVLMGYYAPANDFSSADTYLTTNELLSFLTGVMPAMTLIHAFVSDDLKQGGYKTELVEGEVLWLLIAV